MYKSSFAKEILAETRQHHHHHNQLGGRPDEGSHSDGRKPDRFRSAAKFKTASPSKRYRSHFAATTHSSSVVDNEDADRLRHEDNGYYDLEDEADDSREAEEFLDDDDEVEIGIGVEGFVDEDQDEDSLVVDDPRDPAGDKKSRSVYLTPSTGLTRYTRQYARGNANGFHGGSEGLRRAPPDSDNNNVRRGRGNSPGMHNMPPPPPAFLSSASPSPVRRAATSREAGQNHNNNNSVVVVNHRASAAVEEDDPTLSPMMSVMRVVGGGSSSDRSSDLSSPQPRHPSSQYDDRNRRSSNGDRRHVSAYGRQQSVVVVATGQEDRRQSAESGRYSTSSLSDTSSSSLYNVNNRSNTMKNVINASDQAGNGRSHPDRQSRSRHARAAVGGFSYGHESPVDNSGRTGGGYLTGVNRPPLYRPENHNLQSGNSEFGITSDLGTSDFSSSELYPGSNSEQNSRYGDHVTNTSTGKPEKSRTGRKVAKPARGQMNRPAGGSSSRPTPAGQGSFLDPQSTMPFTYLRQVCEDININLSEQDWTVLKDTLAKHSKAFLSASHDEAKPGDEARGDVVVVLGDFLSELQTLRRDAGVRKAPGSAGKHRSNNRRSLSTPESMSTQSDTDASKEDDVEVVLDEKGGKSYVTTENQDGGRRIMKEEMDEEEAKEMSARLAAKELETLQIRLECQQLYTENIKLRDEFKHLRGLSSPRKCLELQKEIEHLHWQLNKMENSRKLYELATGQLVTFLEHVSSSLAASASLRGSRSNLAASGDLLTGTLTRESIQQAKELSLASLNMARSQSMPGLALTGTLPILSRRNLRLSSRDRLVRRSSSVSRTRISAASPLPSLAETDDLSKKFGSAEDDIASIASHTSQSLSQSQHSFSFESGGHQRVYRRSNSVPISEPVCMSTPRSDKMTDKRALNRERSQESSIRKKSNESEKMVEDEVKVVEAKLAMVEDSSLDSQSKRGTLNSLSSSSTASPPSTTTSRSQDTASCDSSPLAFKYNRSKSMNSLTSGENRAHLASTAQKLIRSLKLVIAREKSYNVSEAEKKTKMSGDTKKSRREAQSRRSIGQSNSSMTELDNKRSSQQSREERRSGRSAYLPVEAGLGRAKQVRSQPRGGGDGNAGEAGDPPSGGLDRRRPAVGSARLDEARPGRGGQPASSAAVEAGTVLNDLDKDEDAVDGEMTEGGHPRQGETLGSCSAATVRVTVNNVDQGSVGPAVVVVNNNSNSEPGHNDRQQQHRPRRAEDFSYSRPLFEIVGIEPRDETNAAVEVNTVAAGQLLPAIMSSSTVKARPALVREADGSENEMEAADRDSFTSSSRHWPPASSKSQGVGLSGPIGGGYFNRNSNSTEMSHPGQASHRSGSSSAGPNMDSRKRETIKRSKSDVQEIILAYEHQHQQEMMINASTKSAGMSAEQKAAMTELMNREAEVTDKKRGRPKRTLSASIVKRSRSFHRIISQSMLSRSKEYSFQQD